MCVGVKSGPSGNELFPGKCQYAVSYSMRRTWSATTVVLGVHGSCVLVPRNHPAFWQFSGRPAVMALQLPAM